MRCWPGKMPSQAYATYNFVKDAKEHFNVNDKVNQADIIGMSHSLAHNNNATAQLIYNVFDKVYSVERSTDELLSALFSRRYLP